MIIKDIQHPWRQKYQQAQFRDATFHVDTDVRAGGRRVALHQYPKRNVPYAEDMGRVANTFHVQGYLIGPNYLTVKNILILALEKDGPGTLRLPMPYNGADVTVLVQAYTVTEGREKGGFCTVDMTFVEYGDPTYRSNISTVGQIAQSAQRVETNIMKAVTPTTATEVKVYSDIFKVANVPNAVVPPLADIVSGGGFGPTGGGGW